MLEISHFLNKSGAKKLQLKADLQKRFKFRRLKEIMMDIQGVTQSKSLNSSFGEEKDLGRPQVSKKVMDKDDFLKLFLTQLKNQDPLQPRDSHELAAQLAQFTSLEKLENIDKGIHQMSSSKSKQADYKVLDLMGKKVFGDLSKIEYRGKEIPLQYTLVDRAHRVEVSVMNRDGEAERNWVFSDKEAGFHRWKWDGLKEDGSTLAYGNYDLKIKAYDKGGKEVEAKTDFEGLVTGIHLTQEGTLLSIGDKKVRLGDVSQIRPGDFKAPFHRTESKGIEIEGNQKE